MTGHLGQKDMILDLLTLQEISLVAQQGIQQEDLGGGWILHYTSADPCSWEWRIWRSGKALDFDV